MPRVSFGDKEFGYQGDYEYKGWTLSIHRRSDGTYEGNSQGYECFTRSKRDIRVKRKFREWVNSLPEKAFTDKAEFLKDYSCNGYRTCQIERLTKGKLLDIKYQYPWTKN